VRMQHGFQSIRNLMADPFLYSKAFGEKPYHPGKLGNSDDVFMSNVTNVRHAVEGKGMVFTQGIKRNRSLNYLAEPAIRLTTAFRIKNPQKLGITIISFGCIK